MHLPWGGLRGWGRWGQIRAWAGVPARTQRAKAFSAEGEGSRGIVAVRAVGCTGGVAVLPGAGGRGAQSRDHRGGVRCAGGGGRRGVMWA